MRRGIIIVLVLALVLSSIGMISGNASAQIKKEDMTWSIGDKWEYRYTTVTTGQSMVFTMAMQVTGESNVEIDGVNYDVYVAHLTGTIESLDIGGFTGNILAAGSTISGTVYTSKDNDATTKTVENLKYQLINETGKSFDFNQTIITVTNSTGGEPDTIDVGTSWVSTIKTITTTMNLSGSMFEYYGIPDYPDNTTTIENTVPYNYECTDKKTVTTTAGTFETYEIRRNEVGGQGYMLADFSSTVKGEVKDTSYDNSGNMISLMELISYHVESPTATPQSSTNTPGFELVIVVCSIAIILLWKRKRI